MLGPFEHSCREPVPRPANWPGWDLQGAVQTGHRGPAPEREGRRRRAQAERVLLAPGRLVCPSLEGRPRRDVRSGFFLPPGPRSGKTGRLLSAMKAPDFPRGPTMVMAVPGR
jgi:hypothetical protein